MLTNIDGSTWSIAAPGGCSTWGTACASNPYRLRNPVFST
jgi:hypothetical protein